MQRYRPQFFGVDADPPVLRQRTDHQFAGVGNAEIHRFAQVWFAVRPVMNPGETEAAKFQVIHAGLEELHAEQRVIQIFRPAQPLKRRLARTRQFPEPAPGEFPADPVCVGCVQYRDH